jgi:hypothetical protein
MTESLAWDVDGSASASRRLVAPTPDSVRPKRRLPRHVGVPETMVECVEIDDLRVHVVGLAVTLESGETVTGAAADLNVAPLERSHFELLERIAISEAGAGDEVTATFQKGSRSNGVALHAGFLRASRCAALELVERDRVLRSWYGGARPKLVDGPRAWPAALDRHYTVVLCRFDEGIGFAGCGSQVAGIIAFPRSPEAPLSMGFAARDSFEDAVRAASGELLQQVAFGWGEPVPAEPPEAATTPEFHLDFYAYSGHHRLLEGWLEGAHEGRGPALPAIAGTFRFTDITPPWMDRDLRVVRAEHPSAVPLVFGLGHPWFDDLPEFMLVQPMA